jgi:predicted ATPase
MIGAYRALAATIYFSGDFETARQYATRGIQIWRSGSAESLVGEVNVPVIACLCDKALCEWHLGEVATSHATMAEAISLAKELNDVHGLAGALWNATLLAHYERNPTAVQRFVSNLTERSMREDFAAYLALAAIFRGWAVCALGSTMEGTSWIEKGIEDLRATGHQQEMPYFLGVKAEASHLAGRTTEALEAIAEAKALAERIEQRYWCAELHRLRGVFLTAMDAEETKIEASFRAAIRTAKEQNSVSLGKRAESTYAEYRRQKASRSEGRGFRLHL